MTTSELVDKLKMPRPFLRKVLQALDRGGLLRSYKGMGGGFIISKNTRNIRLLDLIEIFQGPLILNECSFKKKKCPEQIRCPLRKKINALQSYIVTQLRDISVASLIAQLGG